MADWAEIRDDYMTGTLTYDQIAEKYGVSLTQVKKHGGDEGWFGLRKEFRTKCIPAVMDAAAAAKGRIAERIYAGAEKALDKIDKALETAKTGKEIKALTSAIKDVKEIMDIRTELDVKEQLARIEKMRREAEPDNQEGREVAVNLNGVEEYAE